MEDAVAILSCTMYGNDKGNSILLHEDFYNYKMKHIKTYTRIHS